MSLAELLIRVWREVLVEGKEDLEVEGRRCGVGRTRNQGLRVVGFDYAGSHLEGIEQNPRTSSRWAKLATEGKQILQFSCGGRYVANVCDGRLTRYPEWKAQGLPE